jgi:aspartate/methionine/tyrosine aminotransferase
LYHKRRAVKDVIDLGMGNPSDPSRDIAIQIMAEAAVENHRYSKANGIVIRTIRPRSP